jgi:hypothetical protein
MDGDLLVITSEPPPEDEINRALDSGVLENPHKFKPEDCSRLAKKLADGSLPRVAFEIQEAYQDRLVIKDTLYKEHKPENLPKGAGGYEFVKFCMVDMLMKYEVRALNTYTVVGDGSLFLHSVDADKSDNSRCKDHQDPSRNGRAIEEVLYLNPTIAFTLAKQPSHPVGFALRISVTGIAKLGLSIGDYTSSYGVNGTFPVELRYNPANQTLYTIDTSVRGLVPIALEPFPWNKSNGTYIN